jgi:YebC/PmpR family DNA-binding regulatory protein
MSGHSKWSKVKRYKGALDEKRGKIFSRLSKEIQLAAKSGGDPDTNLRLRAILLKAKEVSMPMDTVKRAINKGTGAEAAIALEEMVYEGYAPAGVAVLVEAVTDNRNRTAADIRSIFDKNGGNMGASGSVAFLFEKKGQLIVKKDAIGEDELMSLVLDAGAEDLKTNKADVYEIVTPTEAFDAVKKALEDKKIVTEEAEITFIPKTTVVLDDEHKAGTVLKLYEALDEYEDVQNVHANFEVSDEIMAKLDK